MTSHCDKLCSGECCSHLLKALALVLRDHVTCAHIPNVARGDVFGAATSMVAHAAIDDPAKLAELMVMGLRARGIDAVFRRLSEHRTYGRTVPDVAIWDRSVTVPDAILLDVKGYCIWRIIRAPDARAKLLAITQTEPSESSHESCERILRGES